MRKFHPLRAIRPAGVPSLALFVALLAAASLRAQDMPPETAAPPEQQPAPPKPHRRPAAAHPSAQEPAAQDTAAPAPPEPEAPKWPANEQAVQATVTWDSHGLSIDAANSSLQQILKDVSAATGTTVDGMDSDQRVFGAYGPGQARDVLSQLLQGAGYNVIMIGDQGKGAPRQILLSQRHSGDDQGARSRSGANNNNEDDSDNDAADDQPVPQPPMRPGFPGGVPRTPQQREEQRLLMQERQQQLNGGAPPPGANPQPQN
jgi:hypothetical protein